MQSFTATEDSHQRFQYDEQIGDDFWDISDGERQLIEGKGELRVMKTLPALTGLEKIASDVRETDKRPPKIVEKPPRAQAGDQANCKQPLKTPQNASRVNHDSPVKLANGNYQCALSNEMTIHTGSERYRYDVDAITLARTRQPAVISGTSHTSFALAMS